jgi:hypothetical protein
LRFVLVNMQYKSIRMVTSVASSLFFLIFTISPRGSYTAFTSRRCENQRTDRGSVEVTRKYSRGSSRRRTMSSMVVGWDSTQDAARSKSYLQATGVLLRTARWVSAAAVFYLVELLLSLEKTRNWYPQAPVPFVASQLAS